MTTICVIALGSRGDVIPCIDVAQQLQRLGFRAIVITHCNFKLLLETHQVEYRLFSVDVDAILKSPAGQQLMHETHNSISAGLQFMRLQKQYICPTLHECYTLCHDADHITTSSLGLMFLGSLEEKLKVRSSLLLLQPLESTGLYPNIMFRAKSYGQWLNKLSWALTWPLGFLAFQRSINQWRKNQLQLKPIYRLNYLSHYLHHHPCKIGLFSPTLIRRPADSSTHYVGLTLPDSEQPCTEFNTIKKFIQQGSPPLLISLGSVPFNETLYKQLIGALHALHYRAIISSGWQPKNYKDNDSIYHAGYVPHDLLLPHVAAVIHHGGAGISHMALRHGLPSLVIPFSMDQYFWANQLSRLQIGPHPINKKDYNQAIIEHKILQLMSDTLFKTRAMHIAKAMQHESGAAHAAAIINQRIHEHEQSS